MTDLTKAPEYNDKEIHLTKEDWIEIYYALDAKIDNIEGYFGKGEAAGENDGDRDWIAHLEEIQCKIDQGQR